MILVIKNIICQQQCCVTITLRSHLHVPAQLMKYLKGECMSPSDQWILSNSGTKPLCHWNKIDFLNIPCVKQKKWVLLIHCNLTFVGQLWAKKYRHVFKYIPLVWFSLSALHKLHRWFNCNALTSFPCSKEFQCTIHQSYIPWSLLLQLFQERITVVSSGILPVPSAQESGSSSIRNQL